MTWSSASIAFCVPLDGGGGAAGSAGMNSDNEIGSSGICGASSILPDAAAVERRRQAG